MAIIHSLRSILPDKVFGTTDVNYRRTVSLDNGRIVRKPAAVVIVNSISDVLTVVKYCNENGVHLTTRSGGHSYAGYCLNDRGVVADLSRLKAINFGIGKASLTVQMGCTWFDVYKFLEDHSPRLAAVGGTCLSVGVAGFLLGGGYGFLSRSYGLGADNVMTLTIVTADAQLLTVSRSSPTRAERDLFWACLGGGGGNFGIVVEAEIVLHALPSPTILGGWLIYPFDQLEEILEFYNDWISGVPDNLTVYGYIGYLPSTTSGGAAQLRLRLQPVFNGPFDKGLALLKPLLALDPIDSRLVNDTFLNFLRLCDGSTDIGGRQSYTRSGLLPDKSLTPDLLKSFRENMEICPSKESFMLWMHQGGACNRRAHDALAFPHRDVAFVHEIAAVWRNRVEIADNVEWAYRFGEAVRPHFTGAFVNYIDPLLTQWSSMYYAENYDRLLAIKREWDPNNAFRFQQSIGSPYEPNYEVTLDLTPLYRTA